MFFHVAVCRNIGPRCPFAMDSELLVEVMVCQFLDRLYPFLARDRGKYIETAHLRDCLRESGVDLDFFANVAMPIDDWTRPELRGFLRHGSSGLVVDVQRY